MLFRFALQLLPLVYVLLVFKQKKTAGIITGSLTILLLILLLFVPIQSLSGGSISDTVFYVIDIVMLCTITGMVIYTLVLFLRGRLTPPPQKN